MALVDPVADRLADQVSAERPDAETVPLEQLAPSAHVAAVGDRLVDFEVVAPAGELETVESPPRAARGEVIDRQVGPLAGEERDGACHAVLLRAPMCADDPGVRLPILRGSTRFRRWASHPSSSTESPP